MSELHILRQEAEHLNKQMQDVIVDITRVLREAALADDAYESAMSAARTSYRLRLGKATVGQIEDNARRDCKSLATMAHETKATAEGEKIKTKLLLGLSSSNNTSMSAIKAEMDFTR